MTPDQFLKGGKVSVSTTTYAIIKAKKTDSQAFVNIVDHNEITVILDQSKINVDNILEIEANWKLLTFEMTLPFELVGFLAAVSQALSQAKVSIFAISAYSTDHILIKSKDLETCRKALCELGCQFIVQEAKSTSAANILPIENEPTMLFGHLNNEN